MSYLALDKWARFFKIISQNGGFMKSTYKLWRFDTLKDGRCVGCDCNGNKYYENKTYMIGRSRWVEYNSNTRWDYAASQVTSEWFGWLHYKTDKLPSQDNAKYVLTSCCYVHNWLLPFAENMTATEEAFYPYGTTKQHIQVWDVKWIEGESSTQLTENLTIIT